MIYEAIFLGLIIHLEVNIQLQLPTDGAKSKAHKYTLTIIILFANRKHGLSQLKHIEKYKTYMKAVTLCNYAVSIQSHGRREQSI